MTDARISQIGIEGWIKPSPEARISQVGLEVWGSSATTAISARISQIGLELWVSSPLSNRRLVNVYFL